MMRDFREFVKTKFKLFMVLLLFGAVWPGQASSSISEPSPQQSRITLSGTVVDEMGEPVIGANVVEKGTTNGMMTDVNGEFRFDVFSNATILISYVGYKQQEIRLNGQTRLQVTLQEDTELLDEVVVVGYGVQKKVNLTGSVATINADVIEARPVTNVSTALAGLAAGVRVNQTSARPGDDSATIRVRGQGTLNNDNSGTLVVIDGIPGTLDAVNPNDIESISILKDAASSAIYGARAGNGVILVTTKRGTTGKPKVTFTGTLSLAQATRLPEFVNDYATYMELINEGLENIGNAGRYAQTDIDAWRAASNDPNGIAASGYPNYVVYPNTDWADAIFENNIIQNYNLGVTGGSETAKYAISAGYQKNPGIISNTGIEKFQTRFNIEAKMANFLTVGTQTFMSMQKEGLKGTASANFNYLRQQIPGQYPHQYDGYWAAAPLESDQAGASLTYQWANTGGKSQKNRINTTLFARLDLYKGLTFETKVNYQQYDSNKNTYPINQQKMNFLTGNEMSIYTKPEDMTTTYTWQKTHTLTYDNVLNYNFSINRDHNFNILLGHNEYYWNDQYDFSASKKGLIEEGIYVPNSAGEEENKFAGNERDRSMRSFFGRLNYDYMSKYLFEFNMRYDGSSRFGEERRWGTFPSVSAAWRISEEDFMARLNEHIQNLKLRASWGRLGADNAGNYDYQALYSVVRYSFNQTGYTGLAQTKMANQYLQWEETESVDIGLEGNVLDSRLSFELGFYNKYTKGILTTPSVYLTAGTLTGPTMNTSDVVNRGIELTLGWRDQVGPVNYGVRGNFSYNHNKVKKYLGKYVVKEDGTNNLGEVSSNSNNAYTVEDYKIGEFYLREVYTGNGTYFNSNGTVNINGGPRDGMIRTEDDMAWVLAMKEAGYTFSPINAVANNQLYYGDLIYADLNGDGIYGNTNDRKFTGKSSLPKYNYGFTIDVEWNNFDLSMIWAGSAGMYYYFNETGYNRSYTQEGNGIGLDVAKDHYFYNPDNPTDPRTNLNAFYPRLSYGNELSNTTASTKWLYNASYLKLKNLQIGYTIPSTITNRYNVSNLRVFLTGENLLMFTPYPFMDPELGSGIGYLPMRQYAFGINLSF